MNLSIIALKYLQIRIYFTLKYFFRTLSHGYCLLRFETRKRATDPICISLLCEFSKRMNDCSLIGYSRTLLIRIFILVRILLQVRVFLWDMIPLRVRDIGHQQFLNILEILLSNIYNNHYYSLKFEKGKKKKLFINLVYQYVIIRSKIHESNIKDSLPDGIPKVCGLSHPENFY